MSPNGQTLAAPPAKNNIYTAILALTFVALLLAAAFIAYKCHVQYGTIFKIP